jgi:hypothetical protein
VSVIWDYDLSNTAAPFLFIAFITKPVITVVSGIGILRNISTACFSIVTKVVLVTNPATVNLVSVIWDYDLSNTAAPFLFIAFITKPVITVVSGIGILRNISTACFSIVTIIVFIANPGFANFVSVIWDVFFFSFAVKVSFYSFLNVGLWGIGYFKPTTYMLIWFFT